MIPRHDQGAGTAGAAAHGGAAVGVFGQLHVVLLLDERKHFFLDPLGVEAGHGVVFQAALAALGVAAAVAYGDGNHDGHAMLGDQVVEGREQQPVGAVRADEERRLRAGDVLLGDIDGDAARVGSGVTGGDDQPGGVVGVRRAESAGDARDAGVDFAIGRGHGEVVDVALRNAFLRGRLRRAGVGGADDEVPVGGGARDGAIGQFFGRDVAGSVGIAGGRLRARRGRGRRGSLGGGRGFGHGRAGGSNQDDQEGDA